MTTAAIAPDRRGVHFSTFSELLADAETIASSDYTTVGKWTFGQILDHLATTIDCSFDGFGFRAPWFARMLIAPFVKNSALTKTMPAGFQLPKNAGRLLPDPEVTVEEALANLKRAIGRYQAEQPTALHPFFGKMTREEWIALTLRHAELHMSFVVPHRLGR